MLKYIVEDTDRINLKNLFFTQPTNHAESKMEINIFSSLSILLSNAAKRLMMEDEEAGRINTAGGNRRGESIPSPSN